MPTIESMATKFEERQTELLETAALGEVRTEFAKYFEAVAKPARHLVGETVPSTKGPGEETLRDAADAESWQKTVKQLLYDEVKSRVEKRQESNSSIYATVHASIDLFKNNKDLVPGTNEFDRELADAVVAQVKDYAVRSDGKVIGYSVPVQPIVNVLRSQLAAQRAAAPPAAAAPTPQQQRAQEQPRTATGQFDAPQAGITSKAGQSADPAENEAQGLLSAFARQNGFRF